MPRSLIYIVIRLVLFLAIWGILHLLTPFAWIFTGIFAAVLAMLISILFLGRYRQDLAVNVQHRVEERQQKRKGHKSEYDLDADDEDALIDAENERLGSQNATR